MTNEQSEKIAIDALSFLVQDSENMKRFLSISGISADQIRIAATAPGFLGGVLDFMMQNEALLLSFSENHMIDAEQIVAAHRQLSGCGNHLTEI